MSCSREFACMIISDAICKAKRNSKPTCGQAKAHESMIPLAHFPCIANECKCQIFLIEKSITKVATKDCCIHCCC